MKPIQWWAWLKDPSCIREDCEGQMTLGFLVKDTFRIEHCAFKVVRKDAYDNLLAQAKEMAIHIENCADYHNDVKSQIARESWRKFIKDK